MRWTGPQRESAIHLPITLNIGAIVRVTILGAVTAELIESVLLEVNGSMVETTLTSAEDAGVPQFVLEGIVTQTWDEPHSRFILRTAQTLPWKSIDESSSDATEFGIAVKAITVAPESHRE
jgi:hypothetical protein